jgi:hypothetical protein
MTEITDKCGHGAAKNFTCVTFPKIRVSGIAPKTNCNPGSYDPGYLYRSKGFVKMCWWGVDSCPPALNVTLFVSCLGKHTNPSQFSAGVQVKSGGQECPPHTAISACADPRWRSTCLSPAGQKSRPQPSLDPHLSAAPRRNRTPGHTHDRESQEAKALPTAP